MTRQRYMELQITTKDVDLDDVLRNYVEEKLGSLEKFKEHIIEGHVVLHKDKRHQDSDKFANVEARLYVGKNLIYAKKSASVMREAIDLVAEKLERQLIKHGDKSRQKNRKELRNLKESNIIEE
jgi:putative sigma-54 modulation protein